MGRRSEHSLHQWDTAPLEDTAAIEDNAAIENTAAIEDTAAIFMQKPDIGYIDSNSCGK